MWATQQPGLDREWMPEFDLATAESINNGKTGLNVNEWAIPYVYF